MLAVLFLILVIPALLIMGGIVAFILLPVKAGIAVAVLAFFIAAGLFSWMASNVDFSH